jgi:hypothetical protein
MLESKKAAGAFIYFFDLTKSIGYDNLHRTQLKKRLQIFLGTVQLQNI